jgi:hypothetical protein
MRALNAGYALPNKSALGPQPFARRELMIGPKDEKRRRREAYIYS